MRINNCILTHCIVIFSLPVLFLIAITSCETDPDIIDPDEVGIWKYYSTNNVLNNNDIRAIKQDKEGVVWVGTYGGGVSKFNKGNWSHITERNGLLDDRIYSIEEDVYGDIWIGTAGGINILTDEGIYSYETMAGSYFLPLALYSDSRGWMWIGTALGIYIFDFENVYPIQFQNEDNNMIHSIIEDKKGLVWFGTNGGAIYYVEDQGFYSLKTSDGLYGDIVSYIFHDSWGDIWFGHWNMDKVTRWDGTNYDYINLHTGFTTSSVLSISEDHQKNIWFALIESGVARYDGVISTTFGLNNGLMDDYMQCSMIDDEGNVWLGSKSAGVHVYIPD
jgi:ligand-binding sensor domain-containing protein